MRLEWCRVTKSSNLIEVFIYIISIDLSNCKLNNSDSFHEKFLNSIACAIYPFNPPTSSLPQTQSFATPMMSQLSAHPPMFNLATYVNI